MHYSFILSLLFLWLCKCLHQQLRGCLIVFKAYLPRVSSHKHTVGRRNTSALLRNSRTWLVLQNASFGQYDSSFNFAVVPSQRSQCSPFCGSERPEYSCPPRPPSPHTPRLAKLEQRWLRDNVLHRQDNFSNPGDLRGPGYCHTHDLYFNLHCPKPKHVSYNKATKIQLGKNGMSVV